MDLVLDIHFPNGGFKGIVCFFDCFYILVNSRKLGVSSPVNAEKLTVGLLGAIKLDSRALWEMFHPLI